MVLTKMIVLLMNKINPRTLANYLEYVVFDNNKEVILNCSVLSNKNTEFTKYLLDNIVKDYYPVTGYILSAHNKKSNETSFFTDSKVFYDKLTIDQTLEKLDTLSEKQYLNKGV